MVQTRKVRDICHKGVICCRLDTPLQEVIRVMADTDVHAIVVCSGEGERPQGIISHNDVIRYYDQDLLSLKASDVMSSPVRTVELETTVSEAVQLMQTALVHRLVVVDAQGAGVGIVSTTDIVRDMRGTRWIWSRG